MLSLLLALFVFAPPEPLAATDVHGGGIGSFVQIAQNSGPSEKDILVLDLSERLKSASDTNTARVLASAIRKLWKTSRSATVNLLMSRAQKLAEIRDFNQAIDILGAVSDIAPDYAQGWYSRADILLKMGEHGRALHDVGKALELEPQHFDALTRLGIILKELGDDKGALNAFEKALSLYPQLPGLKQIIDQLSEKIFGKSI